ncbi:hypothetical protein SDC9_159889 [bioreactor metagenome]|uniref:VOC domain-containing protein n=1 Tax=bioreactor metagenome TaxID=1076179 RepID=A0A645FDW3_9ZZZZ
MKTLQNYGLHHVGFVVKDLEVTADKIEAMYGITVPTPYIFSPTKVWSYGKEVSDYKLKIAMVSLEIGTLIELIQPISGEGVHKDFIDGGHNGLHHICFCVEDYDYWYAHFQKQNAEFLFESETEDELNGFRRCFYAQDTTIGTVYEIKEKPYFRK